MSSEKDTFKNLSNEKPKTMDFSLQSNATKPLDMNRMLGKPSEEKAADTTNNVTTAQEGDWFENNFENSWKYTIITTILYSWSVGHNGV